MRNVSYKKCRENQNIFHDQELFFFFENRGVYEIIWKNMAETDWPQMTV
jgi:hypothetical protein